MVVSEVAEGIGARWDGRWHAGAQIRAQDATAISHRGQWVPCLLYLWVTLRATDGPAQVPRTQATFRLLLKSLKL
jgi:hypothetical protein